MLREQPEGDKEAPAGTALPDAVVAHLPETLRSDVGYRLVLAALVEHGGTCSLSTLTRTLVDEAGWPLDAQVTNPYQQTHLALVREHLPVFAEFDIVEYDEELGTVGLVTAGSS